MMRTFVRPAAEPSIFFTDESRNVHRAAPELVYLYNSNNGLNHISRKVACALRWKGRAVLIINRRVIRL